MIKLIIIIFFLQDEDGIRYWSVTGVQTCALPISPPGASAKCRAMFAVVVTENIARHLALAPGGGAGSRLAAIRAARSEERRVGTESCARDVTVEYLLILYDRLRLRVDLDVALVTV